MSQKNRIVKTSARGNSKLKRRSMEGVVTCSLGSEITLFFDSFWRSDTLVITGQSASSNELQSSEAAIGEAAISGADHWT